MNADCWFGDHNYGRSWKGWVCVSCGYRNYAYLSYLGALGRQAKRAGVTMETARDREHQRAEATEGERGADRA